MSDFFESSTPIRRPILGISITFAIGCFCGFYDWFSINFICLATALLIAASAIFKNRSVELILCAVFLSGALRVGLFREVWLQKIGYNYQNIEVICEITGEPSFYKIKSGERTTFPALADFENGEKGRIKVVCTGNWPDRFSPHEKWKLSGRFYAYNYRLNFTGSLHINWVESGTTLIEPAPWIFRTSEKIKESGMGILKAGVNNSTASSIVQAMLLGERSDIPADLKNDFIDSGTLHLFALSGLHVGVITVLLVVILKSIGVVRVYWGVILIPLLFAYVLVTGVRASTLRAFLMATTYLGAPLVGRRPDALISWSFAAFIVLLIEPLQIRDAGFLLSFSVVGFLIVFYKAFKNWIFPEDWALAGRTFKRELTIYFRSLLLTSSIAWISTVPLSLLYFKKLSLVAPIANLIAVPISFLIVLTGALSLLFGVISKTVAELFNFANELFVYLLCLTARFFANIPCSHINIGKIFWWQIWAWYIAVLFAFFGNKKRHRFLAAAFFLLFLLGFFIALIFADRSDY